jgi:hypothetical protein
MRENIEKRVTLGDERIRDDWREQRNTSFSEPSIAEILRGLDTSEY